MVFRKGIAEYEFQKMRLWVVCSCGTRCQCHLFLPQSFRRGQKAERILGDFHILKWSAQHPRWHLQRGRPKVDFLGTNPSHIHISQRVRLKKLRERIYWRKLSVRCIILFHQPFSFTMPFVKARGRRMLPFYFKPSGKFVSFRMWGTHRLIFDSCLKRADPASSWS